MSEFIHKKYNVWVLMYPIVCAAKYRRMIFSATVDAKLKEVCGAIQKRYEITFLEKKITNDLTDYGHITIAFDGEFILF